MRKMRQDEMPTREKMRGPDPVSTYYKAVRPDGTDFWSGTVRWLPKSGPPKRTRVVRHPSSTLAVRGDHATSLAVSTDPTRLPGAGWLLRLAVVEPVEGCPVVVTDRWKRQAVAWRVVEEVPAHLRFGPMGEHVAALLDAVRAMTPKQMGVVRAAGAAGLAAWDAAWDAACAAAYAAAARDAAGAAAYAAADAAGAAAWDAAYAAAWALVLRDLIGQHGFTQAHYDTLTRPLRLAGVTVHPDDAEVAR